MKNRNKVLENKMKESQGHSIDGQQMFEMLSAIAHTVKGLEEIVGKMIEVQTNHNESIITISDNVKRVAQKVIYLQEQIKEQDSDK